MTGVQTCALPISDDEKKARTAAIQEATKYATEVPFRTMQKAFSAFEVINAMVEIGNPNSITDAGVGALCARSAVLGAGLNVRINAASLKDEAFKAQILAEAEKIEKAAIAEEQRLLVEVNKKING